MRLRTYQLYFETELQCILNNYALVSCIFLFGTSFANHVKSQLRQWGTWKALDGWYGFEIIFSVSETSLRLSRLVYIYSWHFLDS